MQVQFDSFDPLFQPFFDTNELLFSAIKPVSIHRSTNAIYSIYNLSYITPFYSKRKPFFLYESQLIQLDNEST